MKQKLILLISLMAISLIGFSQVNYSNAVGAIQRKDSVGGKVFRFSSSDGTKTPLITPSSVSDSLSNYQKIADGVVSGLTPTTNGDSLLISSGTYRLNSIVYSATSYIFGDIPLSDSGKVRILVVYGDNSGVLDTLSGTQSANPVSPTLPVNTTLIASLSVYNSFVGTPNISTDSLSKTDGSNINQASFRTALGLGSNAYTSTAYLPLSGGTLTGALTVANNNAFVNAGFGYGFKLNDGFNVYRRLNYIGFEYSNSEILKLSATGLQLIGALTATGNITANSLIKSGGTSSQFLKADGSIDATNYQPTISFGAIGSTPNANGASISSGVITLQPASATYGGLVTTGAQTLAGQKQLQDTLVTTKGIRNTAMGLGYVGTAVYSADGTMSKVPLASYVSAGILTKTANYTVTTTDVGSNGELLVRGDATAGNITITLPAASTVTGLKFIIKKIDASINTVTISSASTMDGSTSIILSTQYSGKIIVSNGTTYDIIGGL